MNIWSRTGKFIQISNLKKNGGSRETILVPDWGYKVDFGTGLSYRPDRLHRLAGGPVRQPYAIVGFIPQSWTMNLATEIYR
jgi:hypothetical protein